MTEVFSSWSYVTFVDHIFIFGFVPAVLLAFYLASRSGRDLLPAAVLIVASLTFYVSWGWNILFILLLSMGCNYLGRHFMLSLAEKEARRKWVLVGIITANLSALFSFKYFNLFASTFAGLLGDSYKPLSLPLPLGISFYTFQEIILAVDAYKGVPRIGIVKYVLFIVFFPHLVAGPLVHHREMVPQFSRFRIQSHNLVIGLSLFTIGLAKKICIADALAPIVRSVFDGGTGADLQLGWAWAGALAYAFQIYFDFSGYSDMALGLARLFGIKLPINFYSPYKAASIAEFWRRWHMTLARFLREYVYIPLGGNRRGPARRDFNLMFVMLVGGLWHGTNWTFVLWGGLHGLFLIMHRAWQGISPSRRLWDGVARPLTFACVLIAWVPFRAADLSHAMQIWWAMSGMNGIEDLSPTPAVRNQVTQFLTTLGGPLPAPVLLAATLCVLIALYLFCLALPNSNQLLDLKHPWPAAADFQPTPAGFIRWQPSVSWAVVLGIMFGFSMFLTGQLPQQFLYWSF